MQWLLFQPLAGEIPICKHRPIVRLPKASQLHTTKNGLRRKFKKLLKERDSLEKLITCLAGTCRTSLAVVSVS